MRLGKFPTTGRRKDVVIFFYLDDAPKFVIITEVPHTIFRVVSAKKITLASETIVSGITQYILILRSQKILIFRFLEF